MGDVSDQGRHSPRAGQPAFYEANFLAYAPSLPNYVNRYRVKTIPVGYRVEFIPYDRTIDIQPGAP